MSRGIKIFILATLCAACACIVAGCGGKQSEQTQYTDHASDFEYSVYSDESGNTIAQITGLSEQGKAKSELSIPNTIEGGTVQSIGNGVFGNCGFESIAIPETVSQIGEYAFSGCTELKTVTFACGSVLKSVGGHAFKGCRSLENIVLPDSVEYVEFFAFEGCNALRSVYIPENLGNIFAGFAGAAGITEYTVSGQNEYLRAVDGVVYSADGRKLCAYPNGRAVAEFTVPDGVATIDSYAFYGNANLTAVDLNNVTRLEQCAFYGCGNLSDIRSDKLDQVILDSLDGTKWVADNAQFAAVGNVLYRCAGGEQNVDVSGFFSIAEGAFAGNSDVVTVTADIRLRNIGDGAFEGCSSLQTVYLNGSYITYAGTDIFGAAPPDVDIYVSYGAYWDYLADEFWAPYKDNIKVHATDIRFIMNDEYGYSVRVRYGEWLDFVDGERLGYTFDGWYADEEFSGEKLESRLWTSYADEAVFYAKWKANEYYVTYNTGTSECEVPYGTYTIEDDVILPVPERKGYTFGGWYYDSKLTEPTGGVIAAGTVGELWLYAKWEPVAYTVTYDYALDSGEVLPQAYPKYGTVVYGQSYSLFVPEREGYVFMGWMGSDGRMYSTESGSCLLQWDVAGDMKLTAQWTIDRGA